MICNAKPYEGSDAFLFVSYSRKDSGIVYPLIERLASAGIRIWYDSGIHGGEIWPEVIADHLNRSSACLVFMSQNAVQSHNCFNELIFAAENKKPLIPIRYNEAQLTLGMRMMIGSVQWIDIHDIPSDNTITTLLSLDSIKTTQGIVDRSIPIQEYQIEVDVPHSPKLLHLPIKKLDTSADKKPISAETIPAPPRVNDPCQLNEPHSSPENNIYYDDNPEKTIAAKDGNASDDGGTVVASLDVLPTIVILSENGLRHHGNPGITTLGRTKTKSDILVSDPEHKVSGCHAKIICLDGKCFIEDLNSTNGTYINGERLKKGEKISVNSYCEVKLYTHRILVAFDIAAKSLWNASILLYLRCEETDETKYLWNGEMKLGRNNPWKNGVLQSKKVSHNHALIQINGNECILTDTNSTNGTYINGTVLSKGTSRSITTGDIIQIDTNHFIVTIINFTGGMEA